MKKVIISIFIILFLFLGFSYFFMSIIQMRENILIIGTVNNLLTRNRYMRKNRNWISGEWKYVNQSEKEVCQFFTTNKKPSKACKAPPMVASS